MSSTEEAFEKAKTLNILAPWLKREDAERAAKAILHLIEPPNDDPPAALAAKPKEPTHVEVASDVNRREDDYLKRLGDKLRGVDVPPALIAAESVNEWGRINLAHFLEARGHTGHDLAEIIVPFRAAVLTAYQNEHNRMPDRRLIWADGHGAPDYVFLQDHDGPLVQRVYTTQILNIIRSIRDGKQAA